MSIRLPTAGEPGHVVILHDQIAARTITPRNAKLMSRLTHKIQATRALFSDFPMNVVTWNGLHQPQPRPQMYFKSASLTKGQYADQLSLNNLIISRLENVSKSAPLWPTAEGTAKRAARVAAFESQDKTPRPSNLWVRTRSAHESSRCCAHRQHEIAATAEDPNGCSRNEYSKKPALIRIPWGTHR